jgi:hypothetical protein
MDEIRVLLASLGAQLWSYLPAINWSTFPALHFWFTGSAFFTIGSFALFAVLGFAGIARVTGTYRGVLICGYVAAFILFLLGWWQAAQQEQAAARTADLLAGIAHPNTPPPDVKLLFIYPNEPALILSNNTDTPAKEVLYSFGLWNLDSPPDQLMNPLPVPTGKVDYIRRHESAGPQNIFDSFPGIKPRLKPEDRIFGFVSVTCPDCKTRRSYWLNIKWGSGGWFSEIEEGKNVDIFALSKEIRDLPNTLDSFVSVIPASARKPILTIEELKNASTP